MEVVMLMSLNFVFQHGAGGSVSKITTVTVEKTTVIKTEFANGNPEGFIVDLEAGEAAEVNPGLNTAAENDVIELDDNEELEDGLEGVEAVDLMDTREVEEMVEGYEYGLGAEDPGATGEDAEEEEADVDVEGGVEDEIDEGNEDIEENEDIVEEEADGEELDEEEEEEAGAEDGDEDDLELDMGGAEGEVTGDDEESDTDESPSSQTDDDEEPNATLGQRVWDFMTT
jgi:hypothetical protein